MNGLAATLRKLDSYRDRWNRVISADHGGPQAAPRPDVVLAEVKGFGSNPGRLRMWAYVPRSVQAAPPMVVVLHGCTQSAARYVQGAGWASLADEHGFVILAPEQQQANNPKCCFIWFQPGDTDRGKGEALSIRQMIDRAVRDHNVDRSRIFVTGLSAGGAMSAVMLAAYPEIFAGGAIVGGLPYGTAANVQEAFESMFQVRARPAREWGDLVRKASGHQGAWPRISVWHGSGDTTVQPRNADELIKQWTDVHGLPVLASSEEIVDGATRRAWRKAGSEVIEHYVIPNMGHGVPLNSREGKPRGGRPGPFLLDAGIYSSFYIVEFWGIANENGSPSLDDIPEPDIAQHLELHAAEESEPSWADLAKAKDVGAIIEKALRSAGLMSKGSASFRGTQD